MNSTHLQNPQIPKMRQLQGQISHFFDLKREEEMGTFKKKGDTRKVRSSVLIRLNGAHLLV